MKGEMLFLNENYQATKDILMRLINMDPNSIDNLEYLSDLISVNHEMGLENDSLTIEKSLQDFLMTEKLPVHPIASRSKYLLTHSCKLSGLNYSILFTVNRIPRPRKEGEPSLPLELHPRAVRCFFIHVSFHIDDGILNFLFESNSYNVLLQTPVHPPFPKEAIPGKFYKLELNLYKDKEMRSLLGKHVQFVLAT
eukprot:TRINITY_DN4414_c0_g4_i7.p1 TRINITY_DN4414_c0_g4~~TRINITY_DN4414_c0_g4_i7.p1  ORF type:complete len:195 (-),score=28.64 TRINITY_DN4414_c0_g4_i7:318-902(-)